MRGIDEWLTGEDESMVAGVGEGARGGARRRAAHGVGPGRLAARAGRRTRRRLGSGGRGAAWSKSGAGLQQGSGVRKEQGRHARNQAAARRAGTGPARAARRVGREERRGELGFAGGELGRTPAQQRAAQQGGEARVATCGHVGSDVAVHVGSQRWSEVFCTSSDTLE